MTTPQGNNPPNPNKPNPSGDKSRSPNPSTPGTPGSPGFPDPNNPTRPNPAQANKPDSGNLNFGQPNRDTQSGSTTPKTQANSPPPITPETARATNEPVDEEEEEEEEEET
jgi:hypothetical protein